MSKILSDNQHGRRFENKVCWIDSATGGRGRGMKDFPALQGSLDCQERHLSHPTLSGWLAQYKAVVLRLAGLMRQCSMLTWYMSLRKSGGGEIPRLTLFRICSALTCVEHHPSKPYRPREGQEQSLRGRETLTQAWPNQLRRLLLSS